MDKQSKIYIAGYRGLVGSAVTRKLQSEGYSNLLLKTHAELDLLRQQDVEDFFATEKPDYVFLAAAKVGGIKANMDHQAEFMYENLMIQSNVIHAAYKSAVKKLLFLGSSCIYPRECPQPIKEEYLLTSELEKTNEGYALAKIAGIKMCEKYREQYGANFISAMPTNLYGPNDLYDLENSHVLPALIMKFHMAKEQGDSEVPVWGTGNVRREFLYVDDLADALCFLMDSYDDMGTVNVGTGEDVSIKELAELIKETVGYSGQIQFEVDKPEGTPRKLLDVSKLSNLGWKYKTSLKNGLKLTYEKFRNR